MTWRREGAANPHVLIMLSCCSCTAARTYIFYKVYSFKRLYNRSLTSETTSSWNMILLVVKICADRSDVCYILKIVIVFCIIMYKYQHMYSISCKIQASHNNHHDSLLCEDDVSRANNSGSIPVWVSSTRQQSEAIVFKKLSTFIFLHLLLSFFFSFILKFLVKIILSEKFCRFFYCT